MAIRRKGAAPWSVDYEAGLADAPVSSHPGVEADQVNPVIDAGFIDADGSWQIDKVSNDRSFFLSNQNEAIAAGATMFIEPLDMINHDILILALLDSSGNDINVDIRYMLSSSPTSGSPYDAAFFTADGFTGTKEWTINQVNSAASDTFFAILNDLNETLAATWTFYKMIGAKGTMGNMNIRSNEGANAGTLSAAYMRIV